MSLLKSGSLSTQPLYRLYQVHCHTALGPRPTIALYFSFFHLQFGAHAICLCKAFYCLSTWPNPGLPSRKETLRFNLFQESASSVSPSPKWDVKENQVGKSEKSQSLYFISSLISIFIYFLMPNYHPKDDNSYSNNGCTVQRHFKGLNSV